MPTATPRTSNPTKTRLTARIPCLLFPSIIAVDFSEKGDLFRVVDAVNGVGGERNVQGLPQGSALP